MLLSVLTIISHNSIAHHHHEDMKPFVHHEHHDNNSHDNDDASGDDHHNIFSFAQLDDHYIPSEFAKITIEVPILYLLTPTFILLPDKLKVKPAAHVARPEGDLLSLYFSSGQFSRPPPSDNA